MVKEDIVLKPAPELPPEEVQETNELVEVIEEPPEELIEVEVAHYDIAPTEKQKIAIGSSIILPESYYIPDDNIDDSFLKRRYRVRI